MSIIKEKIKISNEDVNIKINIPRKVTMYGDEQELQKFTEETKESLINPVKDREVVRFWFNGENDNEFLMEFYYEELNWWGTNFRLAGFSEEEIKKYSTNLRNSFFILNLYDEIDSNIRRRISTKYYTKISRVWGDEYVYWNPYFQKYYIGEINQLKYFEIPKHFLNQTTENEKDVYLEVLFYNAKTGIIIPFYNHDQNDASNEKRMVFKIKLNLQNKTWNIGDFSVNHLHGKELLTSDYYKEKINKTNKNIKQQQPSYPTKKYFDYGSGTYVDVE